MGNQGGDLRLPLDDLAPPPEDCGHGQVYATPHDRMPFAKDFFDLQFSFAETVRDLSGESLEVVLLDYTNFYVRFGFGREFNPEHEGWQRYIAGLDNAADGREWTYSCYLIDPETNTAPPVRATFGCFSYALLDDDRIRLHFQNAETDGTSPLSRARADQRRAELAALFAHLKPDVSPETSIAGASWLYNLESYCGLFPPGYVSNARAIPGAFRSMPLWGQFLNRHGEVRELLAESFLHRLNRTKRLDDLDDCFPSLRFESRLQRPRSMTSMPSEKVLRARPAVVIAWMATSHGAHDNSD